MFFVDVNEDKKKKKNNATVKMTAIILLFCLLLVANHFWYAYSSSKNIDINDYVTVAYTTEYEETAYPSVVIRFDQIKGFDLRRKLDRLYKTHLGETYDQMKEKGFVPALSDVFTAITRDSVPVRNGDDIIIDITTKEDFSDCDPKELLDQLGIDIPVTIHYTVDGLKALRSLDFTNGKDLNASVEFYGPDGNGDYRFDDLGFGDYIVNGEDGEEFIVTDSSYDSSSGYRNILTVSQDGQKIGIMELSLCSDERGNETVQEDLHNGDLVHVEMTPDEDLLRKLMEEGYTVAKNDERIEVTGLGTSLDTEITLNSIDLQQLLNDYKEYLGYRSEYYTNIDVYYARLKPNAVKDPDLKSDQLILFLSDHGSSATSVASIWLYNIYRDTAGQIKGEYGNPVSTNLDYAHAGRGAVLNMLSKIAKLSRIQ